MPTSAELLTTVVNWAVPAVLGGIVAALAKLFRMVKATQDGQRALLRSRLAELHERYVVSGHGCPDWVKREAEAIYAAYHALGGNGVGTHYYQEIINAPRGEED